MRNIIIIFLILFSLGSIQKSYAQDSLEVVTPLVIDTAKKHSPKLASLMSAVLPGAGQFYNKQYLKIPAIYILGGALVYSTIANNSGYQEYLEAFTVLEESEVSLKGYEVYSSEQLKSIKDQYRRYRDLSIAGIVVLYALNIVDATVYGHLFDYDVGDDLSLRIEPSIMNTYYHENTFRASNQFGFKCTLNF